MCILFVLKSNWNDPFYSLHSFVTRHQTLLKAKRFKHLQEAITLGFWHTGFLLANLQCHFCSWFIHFNLTLWSCYKFNWPRVHGMSSTRANRLDFVTLPVYGTRGSLSTKSHGWAPPAKSNSLPFYIPLPTEKEPISYIFHWQYKMESVSHIPDREKHYIPCCVIGVSFYIAKNARSESLVVISTAIRYESVKYSQTRGQTLLIRTLKGP